MNDKTTDRRSLLRSVAGVAVLAALQGTAPVKAAQPAPSKLKPALADDREAQAIVESCWPLLDACRAFLDKHAQEAGEYACECGLCEDAAWLRRSVLMMAEGILGELAPWAAYYRRQAEEARRCGDHERAGKLARWADQEEQECPARARIDTTARKGGAS